MNAENMDNNSSIIKKSHKTRKFLVTTPGLSATRWLSFALKLRPDVFIAHGKHPLNSIIDGEFSSEKNKDDADSFLLGNKIADFYNNKSLDLIFEQFLKIMPEAKAIGNVHAFTLEHLFTKIGNANELENCGIINILRHPATYIASHCRLVAKAAAYSDLNQHYFTDMYQNATSHFPELALFDNVPIEVFIPFVVSCLSIHNLAADLGHPDIMQVRMEDLVSDPDQLLKTCNYLTGLSYDRAALAQHIGQGPINKHQDSSLSDPWNVYNSWETWKKDISHMMIPRSVLDHFEACNYDVAMFRPRSGFCHTTDKDTQNHFASELKCVHPSISNAVNSVPLPGSSGTIQKYTLLSNRSLQQAFVEGNYVGVALTGQTDCLETYAALGLVGKTKPAIKGLQKFPQSEALFFTGVSYWIDGQDAKAIQYFEKVDTEHARRLTKLIRKDKISVLAQIPWTRLGCSDFINIENCDPKFEIRNISFHSDDLPNRPNADILSYYVNDFPPDFYICKMVEWHLIPPNIQELPCPIFGHTSDYDLHIQNIYPWLQVFDELIVTDHTEYADVSKLTDVPVSTFPKAFGVPDRLPLPVAQERPIDVFQSGSSLHPYHPDKMISSFEMLTLPKNLNVKFFDGFIETAQYYELLQSCKATYTFVRHPGAMPTRALEALAMGSCVLVQEGSCLTLFAGEKEGVLTYRSDGSGLKDGIERISKNWFQYQQYARQGMENIRRNFSLSKVASQYFRYLTFLAAKPRQDRKICPVDGLKQKRMVISKGWLPGGPEVMKQLIDESIISWEKLSRNHYGPKDYIDLTRELVLEYAYQKESERSRKSNAASADPFLIRKAMEIFIEGIQRFPASLPLVFNAVRTAFHFGTPEEVSEAIGICIKTLSIPVESWNMDPLEDVMPWDFYCTFFNYRAYFDLVFECLGRKKCFGTGSSKLIYASMHYYLSFYKDHLKNAHIAIQFDSEFNLFRYRLAQLLMVQNSEKENQEAADILMQLSHGSVVFSEALQHLEQLPLVKKIKCEGREKPYICFERIKSSIEYAKSINMVVKNDHWRHGAIQKPSRFVSRTEKTAEAAFININGDSRNLQKSISILIPTLDRPDYLKRTLKYYALAGFQGNIIIGDSSKEINAALNRRAVEMLKGSLNIDYMYCSNPPYLHDGMCMKAMVDATRTPYVIYCGDDDFLIPTGLEKCVQFLDAYPSFSAAHGVRINLCLDGNTPWGKPVSASLFSGTNYMNESPTGRLVTYLRTGFSIQYHLHRVEVWKQMYREADQVPSRYLGPELLPCCLSALLGKTMRIDTLSTVFQRNHNQIFSWDMTSLFDLMNAPEWSPSVRTIQKSIEEALKQMEGPGWKEAKALFDREFYGHIAGILSAQFTKCYAQKGAQADRESKETLQAVMNHHVFAAYLQPVLRTLQMQE